MFKNPHCSQHHVLGLLFKGLCIQLVFSYDTKFYEIFFHNDSMIFFLDAEIVVI